jgi:3-phenylpropionate/trans-cinnamate dioxygenase ferredoxin reductase subunit
MAAQETIVIVGAGIAGVTAAGTLRDAGFTGRVVLVCEEREVPYDRPPLSKSVLVHDEFEALVASHLPDDIALRAPENISLRPADWYEQHHIELRLGSCVVGIDSAAHRLTLQGGETLDYSRLILAPGARARRLPVVETGPVEVVYARCATLEYAGVCGPAAESSCSAEESSGWRSRPARSCAIAMLPSSSWHRESWAGRFPKRSPSTLPRFIAARG